MNSAKLALLSSIGFLLALQPASSAEPQVRRTPLARAVSLVLDDLLTTQSLSSVYVTMKGRAAHEITTQQLQADFPVLQVNIASEPPDMIIDYVEGRAGSISWEGTFLVRTEQGDTHYYFRYRLVSNWSWVPVEEIKW
jgi:hypothetical protein